MTRLASTSHDLVLFSIEERKFPATGRIIREYKDDAGRVKAVEEDDVTDSGQVTKRKRHDYHSPGWPAGGIQFVTHFENDLIVSREEYDDGHPQRPKWKWTYTPPPTPDGRRLGRLDIFHWDPPRPTTSQDGVPVPSDPKPVPKNWPHNLPI